MRLAPEGSSIITLSGIAVVLATLLAFFIGRRAAWWLAAGVVCWFVAVLQFFRDPDRTLPDDERLIIAPADGRVISVSRMTSSSLDPQGYRISIFMSPLNVHVNRSPVNGVIDDVTHIEGRFISAFKPEAERENERVIVNMNTAHGRIAFKLVAGFLARRIVFHPRSGDKLELGQRIGMIRFGSRVDVYVPSNVDIFVHIGDKVTAGETIIGKFNETNQGITT